MRLRLVLMVFVLAVAGCARTDPQPSGGGQGPGPGTYGPDDVVLRIDYTGGFVPVQHVITRLPLMTVYGDGRVISQGPMIDIYPSPALPNLQVLTIRPSDVDTLVKRALDRGIGRDIDLGELPIADATATRFTVLTDDGPKVTEAYALDFVEQDSELTAAQRAARENLRGLFAELTDLPTTLGPHASGEKAYQPKAVAAVSHEWTDPGSTDIPAQPERAWPGPALPGSKIGQLGLSCVLVTADQLQPVLSAAASANVLTPWTSGGQRWQVTFRPLLPEEDSCDDLTTG